MMKILTFILLLSLHGFAHASMSQCPSSDVAVTVPSLVNTALVSESVKALKSLPNLTLAIIKSDALEKDIAATFDTNVIKTKMEQFYTLLHVISRHLEPKPSSKYLLDPKGVQDILIKSGVFSSDEVPSQITGVELDLMDKQAPIYKIEFAQSGIRVDLNQGKGFFLYKNGKCQHAQRLMFDKNFSVKIKKNSKKNIVASGFSGVNLVGDFGNRGVVDIDINYVSLRSVEFYKGSQNGKVTAYVAEEEFKKNNHSNLLRIITRFVPDRSVQPIDW